MDAPSMDLCRKNGSKPRTPAVVLVAALLVLIATNLLSYFFFGHVPHINDEIAYLFQAKIFSLGKLTAPSPCDREAFDFTHMINNGRWYSQYPPGFPLILLLGLIVGAPWLINPLLAALSIVVLYHLGQEIYGRSEGLLAAILGAVSIWFLLTSSTMLSHTASMFFFSLFLLFLFRSLAWPSLRNGLLAGICWGVVFLIRPYNAVLIAAPMMVFYGLRFLADPRPRLKNLAGLAALGMTAVLALLVYNQITNGAPLRMGYIAKYGESHGVGFGRTGYMDVPHTPERGLFLAGENLGAINKFLFGWPLSSLLLLIPFFVPLKEDRKRFGADLALLASFLSLTIGLFFYWGTFALVGARMFFEAWPLLILMSARGLAKMPRLVPPLAGALSRRSARLALGLSFVVLTIYAFTVTFPRWVKPPGTKAYARVLIDNFSGVNHRIHRTIGRLPLGRSLVIMKFLYAPKRYFPDGWWGSGFLWNDPRLRNPIVYAQDRGPANSKLFGCFPGRDIYLFVGTLDKGLLVPLELRDGKIRYGQPVLSATHDKDAIELVGTPQELFKGYSAAFRTHLDSLYARYPLDEIDVDRLARLSLEAKEGGDVAAAAFDLEAALQIENEPLVRFQLLNRLAVLYDQRGDRLEARSIAARLGDLHDPKVYDVCPEKGF